MIAPNQVLTIDTDRAVWREIGDELVVLDVPTATYLNLNGSARVLWKRLSEKATPTELTAALTTTYNIPEERATSDVQTFLEALKDRYLLSFTE